MDHCSKKRPLSCGCVAKQKGCKTTVSLRESALCKYQDMIKFRKMDGECWEWTGYRQKGLLPKTSWNSVSMSVRKCMYLIMNDTTFEPNPVYASCGNRFCFNPDHITLDKPKYKNIYHN